MVYRRIANNDPSLNKLSPRFDGPFRITRKHSDLNYEIDKNGKNILVHISQLKLASNRQDDSFQAGENVIDHTGH